jgi:hypothetical protein
MVYVDLGIGLAMLAVAISLGAPNDEFYPLAIALLAFWGVPAALYYPKRWNQRS